MKAESMTMDTIHPFKDDRGLLDELLDAPLRGADLARIAGLENEFEAEMVREALDREGIPCLVQSNRETSFAGIFIPQSAWGSVIVRMDQAEQALLVVRGVRESAFAPSSDQPDELLGDES